MLYELTVNDVSNDHSVFTFGSKIATWYYEISVNL